MKCKEGNSRIKVRMNVGKLIQPEQKVTHLLTGVDIFSAEKHTIKKSVREIHSVCGAEVQSLIGKTFCFSSHFLDAGNKVPSLL